MLILFDHGTPRSIARWLQDHVVVEAMERGWDRLSNGALLKVAEDPQRPVIHRHIDRVIAAVNAVPPGSCTLVDIPYR